MSVDEIPLQEGQDFYIENGGLVIFTENYLKTTFSTDNFSSDYATVPKNGQTR